MIDKFSCLLENWYQWAPVIRSWS